ncbi:MAG: HypC/HybG/HupF family hydrogenase formation chaperone [Candidatus Theseobacter exili]|nr:HypC/HybG/HupF family hydrogenase formation chaperone [Candidatus Theseobacter exili]
MCLAIPARIIELKDDFATVDIEGVQRSCNVCLINEPALGEYVLIHAGFAIQKWSEEDVEEYRTIINEMYEQEE